MRTISTDVSAWPSGRGGKKKAYRREHLRVLQARIVKRLRRQKAIRDAAKRKTSRPRVDTSRTGRKDSR